MGNKSSSSTPPPDPRLVDAQIASMGYQDSAIKQMIENNNRIAPLQEEQLRFGLQTAKTAYDQSQEDRTWMLGRRGMLSGIQDKMVKDANDFNLEGRQDEMANEANADVDAAFSNARGQSSRALARRGINLSSGRALALDSQINTQQTLAKATAANKVRAAARAEGYALTDRANSALAGYPSMGMAATSAGAGYGASGLSLANMGLAGLNSGQTAVGSSAGNMGSNATSMWNAQAQFKSAQDQIAASSDPTNAILGAATGVGMAYATGGMSQLGANAAAGSDVRLKTDIKRVGVMDNGLPVYTFKYKWGGPTVMGVMAHEVKHIVPEAYLHKGFDGEHDAVDYSKL